MKKIIILLLLSLGVITISCLNPDCEGLSELHREEECSLILTRLPSTSQAYLSLEGVNIKTGKPCNCKAKGRWWLIFRDNMSVGDTIIKLQVQD